VESKIGSVAGAIWETLNHRGEMSVADAKKAVKGQAPIFDWALGWLAREDKIVISGQGRSFRVRLKQ